MGGMRAFSQENISSYQSNQTFVCQDQNNLPTTLVKFSEENEPTPFISWYSEYLSQEESPLAICEEVTQKLQNKFETGEPFFLAAAQKFQNGNRQKQWKVCLVSNPDEKCQENSEELFTLNSQYKQTFQCVIEQTNPMECPTAIPLRGPLLSVPAQDYKPRWWPW